ncbi:hypothetical protein [Azospirillum sp. TSO22-1]|uniref:hypothetical protein n=1 Tax=Azospirillum sp. TSO22-1 TaxID=716789 RepID=UPI000D6191BB|nr:hypothetical protein [Azospirillum sp. TSO22-1]PWC52972.1 hypothetical protein TSO221_12075 [Azospirillum sp. TSO22-1]
MTRTLTALAALLAIAAPAALSSATPRDAAPLHRAGTALSLAVEMPFTATVIEAYDTADHTYALVEDEDGRRWLAAPRAAVKPGMAVRHSDGTLQRNLHAADLNRTFAGVYVIAAIQAE